MTVAGIVAEYNPFHTGHEYQIKQTRAQLGEETGILVAMSGNWVQQADCAIFDKWTRAELALMGGADLVIELPTVYATASAEGFARGAVDLLAATGLVTHLSFGSEGGEVEGLRQLAHCIDSPAFQTELRSQLGEGMSFPAARQRAVEVLLGESGRLLASPNNTLGIEYLRAIHRGGYPIEPLTILRRGGAHNSIPAGERPQFTSATDLRHHLRQLDDWGYVEGYLPQGGGALLRSQGKMTSLRHLERAILARLRAMTAEDWGRLPDSGVGEGLPQRLERASKSATSVAEFLELVKTRRYTHARLRRLVLWAFLGLEGNDRPETPPYLRVLAFNQRGREMLREMKCRATLPILTKPAQNGGLTPQGQALFALECRCTDLYTLCQQTPGAAGLEYTKSAIYRRESP